MTGEVTLAGRVLPIGGVKQKLLAAHRAGLTEVIIPARNEPDLDDVPEEVRAELTDPPGRRRRRRAGDRPAPGGRDPHARHPRPGRLTFPGQLLTMTKAARNPADHDVNFMIGGRNWRRKSGVIQIAPEFGVAQINDI